MLAITSRIVATVAPQPVNSDEPAAEHTAISSDFVIALLFGIGVFLTIVLVGFFAFVMWYESKRSGTNPEGKRDGD